MKTIREFLEQVETINELPILSEFDAMQEDGIFDDYEDEIYEMIVSFSEEFVIKDGTKIEIDCEEFHFDCDNDALRSYRIVDTDMSVCMTCREILIKKSDIREKVLAEFEEQDENYYIDSCVDDIVFTIETRDIDIERYYRKQCEKYLAKLEKFREKEMRALERMCRYNDEDDNEEEY